MTPDDLAKHGLRVKPLDYDDPEMIAKFVEHICAALEPIAPPDVAQAARVMSLGDIRPIWKAHGGAWHGPKVEHWSIPEDNMLAFCAALRAIAEGGETTFPQLPQ